MIKGFFGVSSDVGKKQYDFLFDQFKAALVDEIGKLKNIHDEFPSSWLQIKSQLEEMKEKKVPYITFHDYLQRCERVDITKELSKRTLIDFMHDLGIALSFQDDAELRDLAVLNPEWVTKGVYSLIDNAQIALKKGILERSELSTYLDNAVYPPSTQDFIIRMMKKFKLLIEFNREKFLIPDLLPKEEPDTGSWDGSLHFQYSYDIYEKSILRQFIVEMFSYCSRETYWRNGMVLKFSNNRALVKADPKEKTISIKIDGNPKTRREKIAIIRIMFQEIHRTYTSLRFREMVGHPNHPDILRGYDRLLKMETDGIEIEYVDELRSSLKVGEWLDGFQKFDERILKRSGLLPTREQQGDPRLSPAIERQALSDEAAKFEKERMFLRTESETIGRLRSRQVLVATFAIIILPILLSVYYGIPQAGVGFSLLIFVITYLVSHVRGKEWSFFKWPEQLIEAEYTRLLKDRNIPRD